MKNLNFGDKIVVITPKKEYHGSYMPGSDDGKLVLKLENGYNVGIYKNKIKQVKLLEKYKETKSEIKSIKSQKNLPKIVILHTGGTIASKVDYKTGAVVAKFTPKNLLSMFPELTKIANIDSKLIGNFMSENIRFAHYNLMAKEVEKALERADGVIITHGTDTLGYTSAALSFILEDLGKPVILVGAQRSSDRGSSDAGMNLIYAAKFIANSDFAGVGICMHANTNDEGCYILPPCKTKKLHSSRRDAFRVVNDKPYAFVGKDKINYLREDYYKKSKSKVSLKLFKNDLKIGILRGKPQMFSNEVDSYSNYDGLILEGTGLGHMPIVKFDKYTSENERILESLSRLCSKIPVVMTSQTVFGRVNMNVYSPGKELQKIGVLSGEDMLTETAYIKLAWLLSNNKKEVKALVGKNIRGEINKRLKPDDFL